MPKQGALAATEEKMKKIIGDEKTKKGTAYRCNLQATFKIIKLVKEKKL